MEVIASFTHCAYSYQRRLQTETAQNVTSTILELSVPSFGVFSLLTGMLFSCESMIFR